MGLVYVISDLHLGHEAIATSRGFQDSFYHDENIIDNWNSVVRKRDTVWILGDISMEKNNYSDYLPRLNGIKKVVLGNHDMPQHVPELLKHVAKVCGMFKYRGYIMSHAPIHTEEVKFFRGNIHGHTHEKSIDDDRYINASCDVVNYTPVLIDDIILKK